MATKTGHFDLSEINKWIGVEQEIDWNKMWLAQQPIEKSEIRRYALCNEDYNPLWFDEDYAKKTRWKGIIAPPTFPEMLGGRHIQNVVTIPGTSVFPHGNLYLGDRYDFFVPIRIGDKITPKAKIVEVTEKSGSFVGPWVKIVSERSYFNQKGEKVCVMHSSVAAFPLEKAQGTGQYKNIKLEPDEPVFKGNTKGEITTRGATPLYFEDVEVGGQAKPLVRRLTIAKIIGEAASERVGLALPHETWNLGCFWHYIPSAAWSVRAMPAPFDYGNNRPGWFSQAMTDWIGDNGWLKSLDCKIRRPIFAGDTTTVTGKITAKRAEGKEHLVDLTLTATNQRAQVTTEGTATVVLPSRGGEK